ncbi:hypothetical protein AVEN_273654-1 [Araneus ventricosus]|uniref:Uncharacterized protein n=1 Tax=Araneus ventricosus TaxID=182803 RepID=A0A4Y2FBN9_ARAVE|nr:hypothetical protein AVEN_273654-1 [Araneus ventricosus]
MIRKHNSSFQMTSFGTSLPMLDSTVFMPTFRIQGQVYHKPGSLMSLPNGEAKFLQIYFLGNEEAEAKRRCKLMDWDSWDHQKFNRILAKDVARKQ